MRWASHSSFGLAVLLALAPASAGAQLAGEHALLAYGLKSGTQLPPAAFLVPTYFDWDVDHINDRNGNETPIGGLAVRSLGFFTWVVTPKKLLGGNYGFQVIVPLISSELEFPRLGLETGSGLALADIYVMPVNLGWHTTRADYMAGLAFYAPTGRYNAGGPTTKDWECGRSSSLLARRSISTRSRAGTSLRWPSTRPILRRKTRICGSVTS